MAGAVIYVGKAKNLKKRLGSYFNKAQNNKTIALVNQTRAIEITVTPSETEALLLENTLIKRHQPRYNILLRDDKSYPYIYITTHQTFPRLMVYRGVATGRQGMFFGPYTSSDAVRRTTHLLHQVFRLRQCSDSYFRNRKRPCLQYQIKRCSAPCVGYIQERDYRRQVDHATLFLQGKTTQLIDNLASKMEQAAESLSYEQAAVYRNQIVSLRQVLEKQYVSSNKVLSVDVVALSMQGQQCCIQVFFYRNAANHGNWVFYPKLPNQTSAPEAVLEAFLAQYYLAGNSIPDEIIVSHRPQTTTLLSQVFSHRKGRRVLIKSRVRLTRLQWLDNAVHNAHTHLQSRLASASSQNNRLLDLQKVLGMTTPPKWIECFDISHTQGSQTVASCVVFDAKGPVKSHYRHFNIEQITPGDDYAAMKQALERRYTRIVKSDGIIPDLILIDGGKGQLNAAQSIIQAMVPDSVLVAVAKGAGRRSGMEQLHQVNRPVLKPGPYSPALLLICQIRDEAHRFAVARHRRRARKTMKHSVLEEIEGLGPKRRQALIKSFGGMQGVQRARLDELTQVKGISQILARKIYDYLHHLQVN